MFNYLKYKQDLTNKYANCANLEIRLNCLLCKTLKVAVLYSNIKDINILNFL